MEQLRRRQILAFLGAMLAAQGDALAQSVGKVWRIGILSSSTLPSPPEKHASFGPFLSGMAELGYVNGKNVRYEWRSAQGDFDRFPALARELVVAKVDLILAQSTPGVRAARQATTSIPIVFAAIGDPVASGLVDSLAKPGGNASGVANLSVALDAKRVELLAAAVPGLSSIAVLLNPANPTYPLHEKEFRAAVEKFGLRFMLLQARTAKDIDAAFGTLRAERAAALIVQVDTFFSQQRGPIAIYAAAARLPTMFGDSIYVESGGLLSYGSESSGQYRRAATYVDKILKGAAPATLPVEQPTNFELVVNARTARALGLAISQQVMTLANRVIE